MRMERALARVVSRRSQEVLDAYIIEKIKRDQDRREYDRIPLHIEPVPGQRRRDEHGRDERGRQDGDRERPSERGVVIIDF